MVKATMAALLRVLLAPTFGDEKRMLNTVMCG